ncbi:MAG TPA: TonB-dependent receptor, partial [Pyrinomonadaceae bacterium]|nr:TonB-dependent receptor [Pyrinomonadaceae bacterium]
MRKQIGISLLVSFLLCFLSLAVVAQDIQTKGSIRGTITDPNGAVVPGATVAVNGPTGQQTVTTDTAGRFEVANLTPGQYTIKITQTGFKTISANATVYVGRTTTLDQAFEVGETTTTVEVTATNTIDQQSTAIGSNLNDELFRNIPVARGVSGLFYLAPGATDSLSGGRDNPSISGGSALDNLYVADGVNITDSAFGGIGTFSRSYGPLGTGINTSFIKEVQVKTAGFEPQYGQSQGGIVNIVTQSGTNEYHGAVYGYMTPKQFEANRRQPDLAPRFNRFNQLLHNEVYDAGADFGGYVPHFRDHLFFFGSFNPTVRRNVVRGAEANSLALFDSGLRTIRGDEFALRTRTLNYAFKLDYQINPNHQITFSIFGDPSKTNNSSWKAFTPGASIATENTTADSELEFGTRNMSIRYNGTLSPTMTLNASLGFNRSHFSETGFA